MTKEKRTNKQRLEDICDAIDNINKFLKGKSKINFEQSLMLQSAVFRQFEIIGEAASRLTKSIQKKYNDIDWQEIIGMRHKMIHDYFEVSIDITWNAAKNDVDDLKKQIQKVLKEL